jgi:hypothetical protein
VEDAGTPERDSGAGNLLATMALAYGRARGVVVDMVRARPCGRQSGVSVV